MRSRGGTHTMGLVPLQETRELVWSPTHEDTKRRQQAKRLTRTQPRLSPEPGQAGTLISNFPASRAVRNKCLLYKPQVCGILFSQPKLTETRAQLCQSHITCLCPS